jgi:hypothetical protein
MIDRNVSAVRDSVLKSRPACLKRQTVAIDESSVAGTRRCDYVSFRICASCRPTLRVRRYPHGGKWLKVSPAFRCKVYINIKWRTSSYAAFVLCRYSQRSEIGHAGHAGVRALHT